MLVMSGTCKIGRHLETSSLLLMSAENTEISQTQEISYSNICVFVQDVYKLINENSVIQEA